MGAKESHIKIIILFVQQISIKATFSCNFTVSYSIFNTRVLNLLRQSPRTDTTLDVLINRSYTHCE